MNIDKRKNCTFHLYHQVMLQDQMDSLLSSTKVNVSKTLEDFADLNKK